MMKTIDERRAKQGRWGTRVLTILSVSLMLAFIAWAIAEFYGQMIQP
ncbi:hypothetical protein C7477_108136 [Phyllobacterium leguminum]|uniref:Uncharacterized protein n=1 Tax=Phyllobacterium leguminum TaxID=314237 RepID=A0A318THG7_9HYPH|nr:hypothetical protein C7477_108136 [Phyllobacterium leguminum]